MHTECGRTHFDSLLYSIVVPVSGKYKDFQSFSGRSFWFYLNLIYFGRLGFNFSRNGPAAVSPSEHLKGERSQSPFFLLRVAKCLNEGSAQTYMVLATFLFFALKDYQKSASKPNSTFQKIQQFRNLDKLCIGEWWNLRSKLLSILVVGEPMEERQAAEQADGQICIILSPPFSLSGTKGILERERLRWPPNWIRHFWEGAARGNGVSD